MKTIKILTVGKIKKTHWQTPADHYLQRIARNAKVEYHSIKDAPAKLPIEARKQDETGRLLQCVKPLEVLIALDEHGKTMTSEAFSAYLSSLYDSGRTPCFAIGGPYGHAPEIKKRAQLTLALGPMTFTHEMAFVFLLEQLYRAENILMGTGYHHD